MHHLARFAALDHDARLGPQLAAKQPMVQRSRGQQTGDRRRLTRGLAIADYQQRGPVFDRLDGRVDQFVETPLQGLARVIARRIEQGGHDGHAEVVAVDGHQSPDVGVGQDRVRQPKLPAVARRFIQ